MMSVQEHTGRQEVPVVTLCCGRTAAPLRKCDLYELFFGDVAQDSRQVTVKFVVTTCC